MLKCDSSRLGKDSYWKYLPTLIAVFVLFIILIHRLSFKFAEFGIVNICDQRPKSDETSCYIVVCKY